MRWSRSTLSYESKASALERKWLTEIGRLVAVPKAVPTHGVILVWLTAANRDALFPDPNRFDIHRKPNPHLTFGHGIHFCLGAPLARLEAKVALRIMLDRYRDITVATDAPVEYRNPWLMVSVNKLPLDVRAA